MRAFRIVGFLLGAGNLFGCAEAAFSPLARDNEVADIQRALARAPARARAENHTAYLVSADKRQLTAYDLAAARVTWGVDAEVTSRLAVGGDFVAHRQGSGEIVVRAAGSGAARCTVRLAGTVKFLGLAADQDRLYYVTQSSAGASRRSAIVGVSAMNCGELWRDEATGSIGAPAARAGMVAVPYLYQNVVFLDGGSGHEVARVRATDESITFVRDGAAGFVYGGNSGIYRFDEKSAKGSRKESSFVAATVGSSQIRTFYYYDGYQQAQADYTAFDRNRLLWRAEAKGEGAGFERGAVFLHSYRYFFGFDASSGAIRWAYAHPRVDVVGSDDAGAVILFASAEGELGAIDTASGALVWQQKTGLRLAGVTFDAEAFAPPAQAAGAQPSVAHTLAEIVRDPDARFTAVKVFAVDAMTRVPGRETTAELVATVTKEGVAPTVAAKASEALIARRDNESVPLYHEALSQHYDYLADRRVRGIDTLARVSVAVNDAQSTDLLALHLLDPMTPVPALREIVKALVALGGAQAIKPLREFVMMYRCDPALLADPQSLQLASDGLRRLGGADERRLVDYLAAEPRTLPALASWLRRAVEKSKPVVAPRAKAKPGEEQPDLPPK